MPQLPELITRRRQGRLLSLRPLAVPSWVAASFFLSSACSEKGAADTRRELLAAWSTELIVPLYHDFEHDAEALAGTLDALCADPTAAGLETARAAWQDARETWKEAEVFAFGPYSRPGYRIGPQIDSWPARADTIEELLAGTGSVDPAALSALGVWTKGLPALEYMLYAPDNDVASLAEARRCEYLRSLGAELTARAAEMHQAWSPQGDDFAGQLSGAGRTSTAFRSLRDAFGEVVNRMGFTVENIRRDKLGAPLGDSGGSPAPELVESRFSGRSVADIQDNLDGIEVLYFGDGARAVPGVRSYAAERDRDFDAPIRTALDAARSALDAIGAPLSEAVQTAPDRVREANERLGELQSLLQVDLISALGLSLSFNDNDGD